ncbi:hypothetical protein BX616_007562 [Lobosporangium transversale]|uniref:10 TM acyl transferase domain found in Cas1p-domain-containing protein n=1 Tax=Lobosporangium transversale TaxID=64571 RepID=A0A1Y2GTI1_9FUNG|nr:10 TM acyl transferase domain found in Cas1p-domain-containing protein [Lobosporangium transversale]KAF9914785.1 hypothetical protein BX616_007562 [Lobosporangium transversale]ORZ22800.1 10 TM acyl transferase domain found in Cas1p-domain-containing protein [Lobosporangium transversale]|eukprot:XP_021883354.1 10 TM acyl transferase domain found in Cas1p-domain-containing protein [Lobosporangium transversale]
MQIPASLSRSTSSSNMYQRSLQALFVGAAIAVVVLATLKQIFDPADRTRCESLLNHGSWLDIEGTQWQPKGCMLRTYNPQYTTSCIGGSRVVMIGDSVSRQLYYSLVKKVIPDASTDGDRHSDIFNRDPESGTTFEFYWDPVLNSTKTMALLTASEDRVMRSEEKTPSIFLVGTGLWFLRYAEWSGGIDQWQHIMERLILQMGSPRLEPLAQHLFISPIPSVNTEKLSEERLRTLLPDEINKMNTFLKDATRGSSITVPFAWTKMTKTAASETKDGLHYADRIMAVEADILLNYICNNKLPKTPPMSTTCCFDYPSNYWFQTLMLGIFLVWLPLGLVVQTYYRHHAASSFFPSLTVLRSFAVVAGAVVYMYYADRTSLFAKGNKFFSWSTFISLIFLCIVAGSMTLKRAEKDQVFLNRDQTDEWKGWMQIVILIYHYVAASSVSSIYNPIRMLVASYLFMTGFGHFVFYYKKADFGFNRVASILVRLNLLTVLLTYTMNTTYLAYYFAPLVSFFYLTIYVMMYIGHTHNHNPVFIISKVLITAIITTTIIRVPFFLDTAFTVLRFFFGISWSATEWRFRLHLDVWIVFIGALFAYGFIKAQEISITTHPHWDTIRRASIIASVIGLVGYFIFEISMQKFEYNLWHPYISWIPIISFVILRNSTAVLRNTTSTFYSFVGKCSLETFICQFHMWLAGDTKGILVISPWAEGPGAWSFNLALSSFLFLMVAHVLSGATGELSDWLVTGREPKPKVNTAIPTVITTAERMPISAKEREGGSVLPITVKRQSVMVSPIAASAGVAGPATLKNLMEASLAREVANGKPSESGATGQQDEALTHLNHPKTTDSAGREKSGTATNGGEKKEGVVLQIDTRNTNSLRSGGAVSSALSPTSITFKSLWAKPVWKVGIFLGIIWVLNYGSTWRSNTPS